MNTPKTVTQASEPAVSQTSESASAPSVKSVQSVVKPSEEVTEAQRAQTARARKDALNEAAQLLSIAVRNSADVLAQAIENDNPALINQHWKLLQQRLDAAAALLKSNVEGFQP